MRSFEIKKALSAISATAIYKVVFAVQPLILTPLMLHAWGASAFGEWVFSNSLVVILLMFHSGLSQSSSAEIIRTLTQSKENKSGILTFNAAVTLVTAFGAVVFLALFKEQTARISTLDVTFRPLVVAALTLGTCTNLLITPMMTATSVRLGASSPMLLAAVNKLLETAVCAIVLLAHKDQMAIAWVLAISGLLSMVFQAVLLGFTSGRDIYTFAKWFDLREIQRLAVPSLSAFSLYFSANVVILHGTRIIIDTMYGPAVLAVTTTISTYFRSLRFFMSVLPHGLQVELGLLLHGADAQRSARVISLIASTTFFGALILCSFALLTAPVLVAVWAPGIHADWCMLIVLSIGAFVGCLFDFWSTLLSSVNRIAWLSSTQLLSSLVCFGVLFLSSIKIDVCWVLGVATLPDLAGVATSIAVTMNLVGSRSLTLRSLFSPARMNSIAVAGLGWITRR